MSRKKLSRLRYASAALVLGIASALFAADPAMEGLEDLFDGKPEQAAQEAATKAAEVPPATADLDAATEPADGVDDLAKSMSLEMTPKAADKPAEVTRDDGTTAQVTGLEFKHDAKNSRIVVHSTKKLRFSESKSTGSHQYVYLFENASTPEKYQRAYDTTEFGSSVAMFTLFQVPGAGVPTSKLIVQLREEAVPTLVDSDRGLTLEFPLTKTGEPRVVDASKREVLSGDNIYARGTVFTGDAIQRLEIKNSEVQDVLRLIARTSGYNIVIGDDVTGKIGTLSLTNLPWDQAFTLVLQSKRLGFVREGNVLRVGTTAGLRAEKEEAAAADKAQEAVEPLKTLLLPISYAKVVDLVPRGRSFLSQRGSIEADVRTNTIIVKDIEKIVTRVQRLLQALDTQPPRVSISAKIMEMTSNVTRSLGLSTFSANGSLEGVNIGSQFSTNIVSGAFASTISAPTFANLTANLRLAELDRQVKQLANPSVSVVANQSASVTQSLSFFVPNNTVISGVLTPGFTQVTAALNMNVTPIVSGDGSIFITVALTNETPNVAAGNSQIDSRSVTTQVLLENGDTAVIGGIFQNTVKTTKEGIPWLMRIPLLGYFFSGTTAEEANSEIFIFLTAKILNAEESFKRTL